MLLLSGASVVLSKKKRRGLIFGISDFDKVLKAKIITHDTDSKIIIITLTFKGAAIFLDTPIKTFKNRIVSFDNHFKQKSDQLFNKLSSATDIKETQSLVNIFFREAIKEKKFSSSFDLMSKFIQSKNGECTVNDLSSAFSFSTRTIQRKFVNELGIKPKDYIRIIRFNAVCKEISLSKKIDWIDIAFHCGFYDQNHFIKEFKSLMRITPQQAILKYDIPKYINTPIFIEKKPPKG